jgi:hypothetical protein
MVLVTLETIDTGVLLTALDTEAMLHQAFLNVSVFGVGERSRFEMGLLSCRLDSLLHRNLLGVEGGNLLGGGVGLLHN